MQVGNVGEKRGFNPFLKNLIDFKGKARPNEGNNLFPSFGPALQRAM